MKNGSECNPGGCHGLQSRCSDENWEVGSIPTRFRNNYMLILGVLFFTLSFIFPQGMYIEKNEKPVYSLNPNPQLMLASVDCDKYVKLLEERNFEMVSNHLK